MGDFFIDSEKHRINFPDGQWVDIKPELTQEDQDYILNEMATAQVEGKALDLQMHLNKLALLERSIMAWSFPAEVNRDNISRLKNKYRTKVLLELDQLYTKADEFVSKNAKMAST